MDRFLTKRVLEKGDYFIVQSKMDESDLYQIKSDPVVKLTPHPTYNAFRLQNLRLEIRMEIFYTKRQCGQIRKN